jgi:rod shape determining protein RodA
MSQFIGKKKAIDSAGIDILLMAAYIALVTMGCFMVYSVCYGTGYSADWSDFFKTQAGKQIIFTGLSFVLLLFIYLVDVKIWRLAAGYFYGLGLFLLVLVLFFGSVVNGARAWFNLGLFAFQPAEVAKFGTALAISSYVASGVDMRETRTRLYALAVIFAPVVLILLQPDAGSALVFFSFSVMLYREGMPGWPYLLAFLFAAVFVLTIVFNAPVITLALISCAIIFLVAIVKKVRFKYLSLALLALAAGTAIWFGFFYITLGILALATIGLLAYHFDSDRFRISLITAGTLLASIGLAFSADYGFNKVLKAHQRERINVWLRPDRCDPRGAAYNAVHSRLTIGSGGLYGKGYLEGTMTKLKYVPEQETDFIFTAIGEEQGFIGVFSVIAIYLVLLWRIIAVAERQRSNFVRYYGYCVAGIFFFHFFINIGMTMGLMPIIGIPLPFISAGGSSLLGFTLLLGVFIKFDAADYTA